jgi:hypothetical protein
VPTDVAVGAVAIQPLARRTDAVREVFGRAEVAGLEALGLDWLFALIPQRIRFGFGFSALRELRS